MADPSPGCRPHPERHWPVSIRRSAVALICAVDHFERKEVPRGPDNRLTADEAAGVERPALRSVGKTYGEILARLRADFPDSATSIACLRWYASKIREGHPGFEGTLPQRRPKTFSDNPTASDGPNGVTLVHA